MTAITTFIKRHPLAAFFTLACSLTWFGGWASDTIYNGTLLSIALALPFALLIPGPVIAALLVTAITGGKPGLRALLRGLTQWRVGLRWYLIALLLPSALSLLAVYLNVLLGAPAPTAAQFVPWSSMLFMFGLRLVNPFDGPVMEELGWRGYALPRLQARYSPLTANIILGVVVAIWHLRWIVNGDLPVIYLPAIIAATVLFGWIVNSTRGSVLLALLFHAADGLIIQGNFGLAGADAARLLWLQVAVWCLMAVVVVLARGRNLGSAVTHPTLPDERATATVYV
jgi:membrane protease YdiL (CAAX protease family)